LTPARGDEHLAIVQRRDSRIPAARRYVRAEAPQVRQGIEEVSLDDAVELLILVPTGHEHPSVDEMREAAAEDVEAGVGSSDVWSRFGNQRWRQSATQTTTKQPRAAQISRTGTRNH
jgi:hypothetical protein